MSTKVTISFSSAGRPLEMVEHILICSGLSPDLTRGSRDELCVHTITTDEATAARLRSALAEADLEWIERRERDSSSEELLALSLLRLRITRAPRALGGPANGTEYNLSTGCSRCGTGAVQTSPLFLKRSEVPRTGDVFETLDGEVLISPRLCEALHEEGLAGAHLVRARDARTKTDLDWFQVSASDELPKMLDSSPGLLREDPCPECERDGYFMSAEDEFELHYKAIEVRDDDLPDVVRTYEHFGNSILREPFEKSHFALPLLLVKPRVADFLKRHDVRAVAFDAVRLVA